jgi:Ni,Fe-hydrogenase III large subunit
MDEFIETPERRAIVTELEQAQAHLVHAADLLGTMGLSERSHKTLNIAQRVANKINLLALDWRDEDAKRAA